MADNGCMSNLDTLEREGLRAAQVAAIKSALGARVAIAGDAVHVDGEDVSDIVDDVAVTLEVDADVGDIVTRILICLGGDPFTARREDN